MVSSKRIELSVLVQCFYLRSNASIVLIPGIGTTSPENWPFASQDWLASLPSSGTGARILAYEYASPFAVTKPSWESILMLGYDLLQHLYDARSQPSHSLVREAVQNYSFGLLVSPAVAC